MHRAQKKQEAKIKRLEPARPPNMPSEASSEMNVGAGHRGSVVTIGRSVGSFASSTSLYNHHQNGSNKYVHTQLLL
jgi:hypothetical protein